MLETGQTLAPQSNDALVYWIQHEDLPYEVNLQSFANGQNKSHHKKGGGRKFKPFSGRPELIQQLAPALREVLSYCTKGTARAYLISLREWWRIMDSVEAAAAAAGHPMKRVDDVRLLTQIHCQAARSSGMNRKIFGTFRTLVDTTLTALGAHKTYWEAPEDQRLEKRIPSHEQRTALRFEVKRTCRKVLELWAQSDRISESDTEPEDLEEANIWKQIRCFRMAQETTGKAIPLASDLAGAIPRWARNSRGNLESFLWQPIFPSHRDADAVWHQCLLNTGWNPSTLTTLDATKSILFDHFKDDINDPHQRFVLSPQTYELVGTKGRALGKEQIITGQWKTLDAPGHLIKKYLERVKPLREALNNVLTVKKTEYEQMGDASYKELAAKYSEIQKIEQGVRSVWLYVTRWQTISWITGEYSTSGFIEGKPTTYLGELVHALNKKRLSQNPLREKDGLTPHQTIPHVRPKDFRVWFADYVYRSSRGNILHVKRSLNHSRVSTTLSYISTNVLNQESSNSARRFLNILISELDTGRVDLAILAHLYRHGEVTSDQEEILAKARALPKSRMNVACKDSLHPPPHLKATPNAQCDVQRCMLCVEHAVLLPESLDGLAMRVEELRALQGVLPLETWIDEMYNLELKNNLIALRRFDLNLTLLAREKWAHAIATGDHYVPGLPLASSPELMELV